MVQAALIRNKYIYICTHTQYTYKTVLIRHQRSERILKEKHHIHSTQERQATTSGSACPPLTKVLRPASCWTPCLPQPWHSCMTHLSMASCSEAKLRESHCEQCQALTHLPCMEDMLKMKIKSCLKGMKSNSGRGGTRTLQPFQESWHKET